MPRYLLRRRLVLRLLRAAGAGSGRSSLEVGYGSGDLLAACARLGLTAHGFDFSPLALERARGLRDRQPADVAARMILLEREEQIRPEGYDLLLACEVLEHLADDRAGLARFHGWLRPGGSLILSVPAHMRAWGRNDELAGHYRRYEKAALTDLLAATGFEVTAFWSYGFPLVALLDVVLHRSAAGHVDQTVAHGTPEELSQQSGVRRNPFWMRWLINDLTLLPFHLAQEPFLHRDLSTCYLLAARRRS